MSFKQPWWLWKSIKHNGDKKKLLLRSSNILKIPQSLLSILCSVRLQIVPRVFGFKLTFSKVPGKAAKRVLCQERVQGNAWSIKVWQSRSYNPFFLGQSLMWFVETKTKQSIQQYFKLYVDLSSFLFKRRVDSFWTSETLTQLEDKVKE